MPPRERNTRTPVSMLLRRRLPFAAPWLLGSLIIALACQLAWHTTTAMVAAHAPLRSNNYIPSSATNNDPWGNETITSVHNDGFFFGDDDDNDDNESYHPMHIPVQVCRSLSVERCRQVDQEYGRRRMAQRQNRRGGRRLNPATGTNIRILVLLIKFSDHKNMAVPPRSYYETLFNGSGPSDVNAIGSLKDYFRYNSMGKYRVSYDVRDWQVAPNTEAFYAGGTSGFGTFLQAFFTFALTKIDNDPNFDWNNGYVDEFGYLNGLVVLHSGIAAEWGDPGKPPCISAKAINRIWSVGSGGPEGGDNWVSKDFMELSGYAVASAWNFPGCGQTITGTRIGGICHEHSHGFGLEDMYDAGTPSIPIGGLGTYSIMASSQGWELDEGKPGHMSTYDRQKLNWVQPILIDKDGYYAIQPQEISSTVYKITKGYPAGEYLLIENKQPLKWDADVPTGGIVIFHVDEKADGQKNRGYPGMAGFPGKHYKVAVLPADGKYDIEKGVNNGDTGDFWREGMTLGSGGSYPNTDSYQGGVVKATGVSITVLSKPGLIMMFQVSGMGARDFVAPSEEGNEIMMQDNSTNDTDSSLGGMQEQNARNTTGQTLAWMLAMITGLGLMLGLLVFIL